MKKLLLLSLLILCQSCWLEQLEGGINRFDLLVIGDSHSSGGVVNGGTTYVDVNTLYEWEGKYDVIVTDTVGSGFYPAFAQHLKYHYWAKTYLMNGAKGGTSIAGRDVSKRWGEESIPYINMLKEANEYLAYTNKEKFSAIRLGVGGWDGISGTHIETIRHHYEYLINRLHSDFPDTVILLSKVPNTTGRFAEIRVLEDSLIQHNDLIYELYDYSVFDYSQAYKDKYHLYQEYENVVGEEDAKIVMELIKKGVIK